MPFYLYQPERFMAFAETFLGLPKQPEAIDEVREVSHQIMYTEGRDGSLEHGGGWPGISMYREMTTRNVAAAMRLGVRDPADIASFDFWKWAKHKGLSTLESVRSLLGELGGDGIPMSHWELRAAVEAHSVEEYASAEQAALLAYIRGLGYESASHLEEALGYSIKGMTMAEVQAIVPDRMTDTALQYT